MPRLRAGVRPYRALECVISSDVSVFGKKYFAGEIDSWWTEAKEVFSIGLTNYPGKPPMTKKELNEYLKERNYQWKTFLL